MGNVEDLQKRVGENIRKYRKERKMTLAELGALCEIEKSNLIHIEKGRKNITLDTLLRISDALEIKPFELLK